jgi:hypothetical protein
MSPFVDAVVKLLLLILLASVARQGVAAALPAERRPATKSR